MKLSGKKRRDCIGMKQVSITIDARILKALDEKAAEERYTRADIIRTLYRKFSQREINIGFSSEGKNFKIHENRIAGRTVATINGEFLDAFEERCQRLGIERHQMIEILAEKYVSGEIKIVCESEERKMRKDLTIYNFIRDDGTVEQCTRYDLTQKYNLNSGGIAQLVAGRLRVHNGWSLVERLNEPRYKGKIHKFINKNGTTEECTIPELARKYKLNGSNLCRMVRGERKIHEGWYLATTDLSEIESEKKYSFVHSSGKTEVCTRLELCEKYGIPTKNLANLIKGRTKTCDNWKLADRKEVPKKRRKRNQKYHFIHFEGKEEECSLKELAKKYELKMSGLTNLVHERIYMYEGWRLFKN